MAWTVLEHAADLRIEIVADSYQELFIDGMLAMTAWIGPRLTGHRRRRRVRLEAPDCVSLLVDFLNELLSLGEVHHEAYYRMELSVVRETLVAAVLEGESFSGALREIKAVTYHGASVEQLADGRWRAELLMDI